MLSKRSNDLLLPVSSSLSGMGFSSSWVFTSIYMHDYLSVSYLLAGLVFTASGIAAALAQIYAGRLGDRFGHKAVLLGLVALSGLTYFLIFYVSSYFLLPLIFSILFVINIAVNSAILSPLNSLVSLSSESPLKGFSYLRMGNNVGWGFGPMAGGILVSFYGYPYIYLLGLGMNIANAFVILSVKNVSGMISRPERGKRFSILPMYLYLGISALLLFMIQGQESVTFPNFASSFRQMSAFDIGIIFFVNGIFVIILQTPITRITGKIGLSRGFTLGIALYAIGFFTVAFDYNLLEFILSIIVVTVGENFAFPAGSAIVSTLSRNENIGYQMGVFNAFISVGRSLGPVVGGAVLDYFTDPVMIWFLVTVSGLLGIILYTVKLSSTVNRAEKGTA